MPRHRNRTRHDQNFKVLLSEFFIEFIQLFFPATARRLDKTSVCLLDKEYFDRRLRRAGIADLVIKAKLKGKDTFFVILLEAQAKHDPKFPQRLFHYFAGLDKKYSLPVFPIALHTYDTPLAVPTAKYEVKLLNRCFLRFQFEQIQLNQLKWQEYLRRRNPIACALIAKMRFARTQRPEVRYECIKLATSLKLPDAKLEVILWFIDEYLLPRNAKEQKAYDHFLEKTPKKHREAIMKIMTSWERQGMKKGRKEGRQEEAAALVLRLLTKRFGELDIGLTSGIRTLNLKNLEKLSEALLDFTSIDDLSKWLDEI